MTTYEKLQQAINELQHLTGLPIEIRSDENIDTEETLEKVRSLCQTYRNANRKEDVIRRWLSGEMTNEEFFLWADRMHLDRTGKRAVYLIQLEKEVYPEISLVLRNMFPDSRTWILPYSQNQIMVICHRAGTEKRKSKEIAYELLDALNTELMEQVSISYSAITGNAEFLPSLCRQSILAMQVGTIFYPDRNIHAHDELGLGKLLYDSSEEKCRDYIRDNIGEQFLSTDSPAFEADIQYTANTFLDNNMNIAETARQLHIHRNTLLYRLEQIENETGLDIRRFDQAMTYRICSMILLYLK